MQFNAKMNEDLDSDEREIDLPDPHFEESWQEKRTPKRKRRDNFLRPPSKRIKFNQQIIFSFYTREKIKKTLYVARRKHQGKRILRMTAAIWKVKILQPLMKMKHFQHFVKGM